MTNTQRSSGANQFSKTFLNSVFSTAAYASSSVAIMLFNKAVLSVYKFKYSELIALAHMSTCLVFLALLKQFGVITYADFDLKVAKKVCVMSVAFVANISIGLAALGRVDVPMFTTLRRLTAILIMVMEYRTSGVTPSTGSVCSVSVMVLGSLIAGAGDLSFDLIGYCFVICNNIATATYLVGIKSVNKSMQLDSFTTLFYNSVLAIPMLVLVCLVNGSFSKLMNFPFLWDGGFQVSFFSSSILAFFLNYATFWCTNANSALTTSVTGQVKNILTSLLSMLVFEGDSSMLTIFGLVVGIVGSMYYSYVKFHESDAKKSDMLPKYKEVPTSASTEMSQPDHLKS